MPLTLPFLYKRNEHMKRLEERFKDFIQYLMYVPTEQQSSYDKSFVEQILKDCSTSASKWHMMSQEACAAYCDAMDWEKIYKNRWHVYWDDHQSGYTFNADGAHRYWIRFAYDLMRCEKINYSFLSLLMPLRADKTLVFPTEEPAFNYGLYEETEDTLKVPRPYYVYHSSTRKFFFIDEYGKRYNDFLIPPAYHDSFFQALQEHVSRQGNRILEHEIDALVMKHDGYPYFHFQTYCVNDKEGQLEDLRYEMLFQHRLKNGERSQQSLSAFLEQKEVRARSVKEWAQIRYKNTPISCVFDDQFYYYSWREISGSYALVLKTGDQIQYAPYTIYTSFKTNGIFCRIKKGPESNLTDVTFPLLSEMDPTRQSPDTLLSEWSVDFPRILNRLFFNKQIRLEGEMATWQDPALGASYPHVYMPSLFTILHTYNLAYYGRISYHDYYVGLLSWSQALLKADKDQVNFIYAQKINISSYQSYLLDILLDTWPNSQVVDIQEKIVSSLAWFARYYDASFISPDDNLECYKRLNLGQFFSLKTLIVLLTALQQTTSHQLDMDLELTACLAYLTPFLSKQEWINVLMLSKVQQVFTARWQKIQSNRPDLDYRKTRQGENQLWVELAQKLSSARKGGKNYYARLMPTVGPLSLDQLLAFRQVNGPPYALIARKTYAMFSHYQGCPVILGGENEVDVPRFMMVTLFELIDAFFSQVPLATVQSCLDKLIEKYTHCSVNEADKFNVNFLPSVHLYLIDILLNLHEQLQQGHDPRSSLDLEMRAVAALLVSFDKSLVSRAPVLEEMYQQESVKGIFDLKMMKSILTDLVPLLSSELHVLQDVSHLLTLIEEKTVIDEALFKYSQEMLRKRWTHLVASELPHYLYALQVYPTLKRLNEHFVALAQGFASLGFFSIVYQLRLETDDTSHLETSTSRGILVKTFLNELQYTVQTSSGDWMTDTITAEILHAPITAHMTRDALEPLFERIWLIAAERGHAYPPHYYYFLMPTLRHIVEPISGWPLSHFSLMHCILEENQADPTCYDRLIVIDHCIDRVKKGEAYCYGDRPLTSIELARLFYGSHPYRDYVNLIPFDLLEGPVSFETIWLLNKLILQILWPSGLMHPRKPYTEEEWSAAKKGYEIFDQAYRALPSEERVYLNAQRILYTIESPFFNCNERFIDVYNQLSNAIVQGKRSDDVAFFAQTIATMVLNFLPDLKFSEALETVSVGLSFPMASLRERSRRKALKPSPELQQRLIFLFAVLITWPQPTLFGYTVPMRYLKQNYSVHFMCERLLKHLLPLMQEESQWIAQSHQIYVRVLQTARHTYQQSLSFMMQSFYANTQQLLNAIESEDFFIETQVYDARQIMHCWRPALEKHPLLIPHFVVLFDELLCLSLGPLSAFHQSIKANIYIQAFLQKCSVEEKNDLKSLIHSDIVTSDQDAVNGLSWRMKQFCLVPSSMFMIFSRPAPRWSVAEVEALLSHAANVKEGITCLHEAYQGRGDDFMVEGRAYVAHLWSLLALPSVQIGAEARIVA